MLGANLVVLNLEGEDFLFFLLQFLQDEEVVVDEVLEELLFLTVALVNLRHVVRLDLLLLVFPRLVHI